MNSSLLCSPSAKETMLFTEQEDKLPGGRHGGLSWLHNRASALLTQYTLRLPSARAKNPARLSRTPTELRPGNWISLKNQRVYERMNGKKEEWMNGRREVGIKKGKFKVYLKVHTGNIWRWEEVVRKNFNISVKLSKSRMTQTEHACNGMCLGPTQQTIYNLQRPILELAVPIWILNTPLQELQAQVEGPADWR